MKTTKEPVLNKRFKNLEQRPISPRDERFFDHGKQAGIEQEKRRARDLLSRIRNESLATLEEDCSLRTVYDAQTRKRTIELISNELGLDLGEEFDE